MSNASIPIPVPDRFLSNDYTSILSDTPCAQTLVIQPTVLATMQETATTGYPNEICGLLIGTTNNAGWQVMAARQVANLNQERASDRFQLDPAGYQNLDRELRSSGSEIIGVFHSHPDCPARPSPTDISHAWEGFLYPIISVCAGSVAEIRWWTPSENSEQFQWIESVNT
ncbi:MAG: M67 family metallopeptidase [Mariprofundales bacterium]